MRTAQEDRPGVLDAALLTGSASQYLTFTLGPTEYAIDILKTQEIRGYDNVTAIANAPAFIKGVINLRGAIVPILDLRIKFAVGQPSYDAFTVVIVLNVLGRIIGIVVDSVSDVVAVPPERINPPPEFGAAFDTQYIKGLTTLEQRMIILIDIEKLMSSKDMDLLDEAVAA